MIEAVLTPHVSQLRDSNLNGGHLTKHHSTIRLLKADTFCVDILATIHNALKQTRTVYTEYSFVVWCAIEGENRLLELQYFIVIDLVRWLRKVAFFKFIHTHS